MRRGEAFTWSTGRSWIGLLCWPGLVLGLGAQAVEAQPFSLTQITNTAGGGNNAPSINAAGTRIVFMSDRNTTELTPCQGCPGNADGSREIFLFDTTTSAFTQITNTTGGFTGSPSINAAGTRIAFNSDRDLTGSNADGNDEVYLASSGSTPIPTLSEWA